MPKPADELSLSEGPGTPEAAVASLTCRCSGPDWLWLWYMQRKVPLSRDQILLIIFCKTFHK